MWNDHFLNFVMALGVVMIIAYGSFSYGEYVGEKDSVISLDVEEIQSVINLHECQRTNDHYLEKILELDKSLEVVMEGRDRYVEYLEDSLRSYQNEDEDEQ